MIDHVILVNCESTHRILEPNTYNVWRAGPALLNREKIYPHCTIVLLLLLKILPSLPNAIIPYANTSYAYVIIYPYIATYRLSYFCLLFWVTWPTNPRICNGISSTQSVSGDLLLREPDSSFEVRRIC